MYGVKLARELGDKGYTVLLIHPGYVKTDMVRAFGLLFFRLVLSAARPDSTFLRRTTLTEAETSPPKRLSVPRAYNLY